MKRTLFAGLAALAAMSAATTALADRPQHARGGGHGQHECLDYSGRCEGRPNPGHGANDERHGGRHLERHADARSETHVTIRIGDDGRRGERWAYRSGHGFGPAPYGKEYRVMDGQLVLVDSQTLQIVAIVGLLTALIN
ncbi:MAG: hypothetical protein KDK12_12975 [Rhodobacteraceae bacterium]|nr:hypothetical protein [Paracoccaceae bacterium]